MFQRKGLLLLCIVLLFTIIYFPVLTADFAYLDEIHQLWNNHGLSNRDMFLTQGRWLTGLLFQHFFGAINAIEDLKWLRLFSFTGWVLTTFLFCLLLRKWVAVLRLQPQTLWLGALYCVCSLSVVIFIGWASCMEIFAAVAAGLLSGHVLFTALQKQGAQIQLPNRVLLLALVLGVTSLFIYQTAFGIFLLPFLLQYTRQTGSKPSRHIIIGVAFYLLTYGVYYLLFKYSLQAYGVAASDRTGFSFDLLRKLSFFFSGPLPQAFSLNVPFHAGSIFSQVLYPAVLLLWVVSVFKNNRQQSVVQNSSRIVVILFLLALIYLPLMIAKENFASYRTLYAFNLAVFLIVIDCVLQWLKAGTVRKVVMVALALLLLATSFYTFHYLFVQPLKKEYSALRNYMQAHYNPAVQNVYFIRADKFLFANTYGTKVYRDEFGLPSTFRDWVPEPITKQIAFELTGNRSKANQINVVQFENKEQWQQSRTELTPADLLVDMDVLFRDYIQKN
ncbi:MAG: hypothetical protein ACO1NX_07180 [Chitinophagaceae bacterium]